MGDGEERKCRRRVFPWRPVLSLLDPRPPPLNALRLRSPRSWTLQQRREERERDERAWQLTLPVKHREPSKMKKKTLWQTSKNLLSLCPGMGDDHGPAVGEDFKYSTGLTTAGKL